MSPDSTTVAGREAEDLACRHLESRGLRLLERNYRCRAGELDLVMRERDQLVFVEVRYRSHRGYGSAVESVDARKQRRLIDAARHYLQRHGTHAACRFDVVGIDAAGRVEWLRDAFGT